MIISKIECNVNNVRVGKTVLKLVQKSVYLQSLTKNSETHKTYLQLVTYNSL